MKFKKNNLNTTIILLFYFINIQNSTINLPDTFPENGCISFPVELDGFGTVQATMRIDYDSPYFSDSEQSSYNNVSTSSNEIDWREQHSKDWHSHHQQETTNNYNSQTYTQENNNIRTTQYELFDKALDKTKNSYDLANKYCSPIAEQYLKQLRKDTADKFARKHRRFLDRKKTFPLEQAELKFLDLLISKEITELLKQISHPDLPVAQAAFAKLKELWPWKRDHTFLTASFVNGTGETGFNVRLGIDIMAMAERDLISRPDYIAQHTDPKSFKTIQEFREKCINFQQKGNQRDLSKEYFTLRDELYKNRKNDDFTTNVCYAIVEKIYSDPITNVLYGIVHAQSLEKAHNQLHYLEMQILDQTQQHNITLTDQIKDFIIKQYGFDLIEASYNCYTSHPDYIKTVNDQPILSNNNISPILHNIENKPLSAAHKELTHLQKQIIGTFESLNITDKAIQKELIIKKFGIDILEQTNNAYKNRSDHKELTNSFIPIDVHNNSINILNNSHDYASVGQQFDTMAEQVFHNAKLCKLDFIESIENHVIDSIHIIKTPQNDARFVFNVTVVDHLLTDIQHKVDDIVEGKSTSCIKRGSELFTRAIVKFIEGINPITQAQNIGHFIKDTALFTGYLVDDMFDVALHPNVMEQKNFTLKMQLCESLINTAKFTSDILFGRSYLTPEEYIQRSNVFWEAVGSIPAEHIVDLVAQVAADFVFGKGFIKAFVYLKEIDAATRLENYATKVADKLKQAVDTHLADNPIVVAAEGVALQMSTDLKHVGSTGIEVINNSKFLLESAYTKVAIELEAELKKIRPLYEKTRDGFSNFINSKIRFNYEHILGMEINLSKKGTVRLGGFHHDLQNFIEKNSIIKFENKVIQQSGCYTADLIIDGIRVPGKTFFPAEWSRKQVIDKLHEAYDNFLQNGAKAQLLPDGKYKIKGYTKEGIEIEMLVTQKGQINTAYPKI